MSNDSDHRLSSVIYRAVEGPQGPFRKWLEIVGVTAEKWGGGKKRRGPGMTRKDRSVLGEGQRGSGRGLQPFSVERLLKEDRK